MSILDRKLRRDLWAMRAQVLSVALLLGAGVAVLIGSVSTYLSLRTAQEEYYRTSRFADLWVELERAPSTMSATIAALPGVGIAEPRVVKDVRVEWERSDLSVAGAIVSLPRQGQPSLNRLDRVKGRWLDPARLDEVLVNAGFASTWGVDPGDTIRVILNGRVETFRIAGIVHSPEYIYAARPGNPLPDDRTFVVLWANDDAVAAAFDMKGAFNNLVLTLAPGASALAVAAQVDAQLDRYGGRGAYERRDQASHRFLADELAEQRTLAIFVPVIFFGIASFLLNVLIGRLVDAQREQIAALKALGFPSMPIAIHYLKLVGSICALGAVLGVPAGYWYALGMIEAYRPFFRFPDLPLTMPMWVPMLAIGAGAVMAAAGALAAVRRVLRLKPAEALRSETPAAFSRAIVGPTLPPAVKMTIRGLLGRPVRSVLTIFGLAFAVPMVVLGLFWWDALDYMVQIQFDGIERADAVVTFTDPRSSRSLREIASLDGVSLVEGQRIVPVRLRAGNRTYRLVLTGIAPDSELRVPRAASLQPAAIPADGIILSKGLAERLGVAPGDEIMVETLEGRRQTRPAAVVSLIEDVLGYSAYMNRVALNRLMREDDLVSQAALRVDPKYADAVWKRLAERPRVLATSVKRVWLQLFNEKVAAVVTIAAVVLTLFGVIIAVGVVYNSARVSLQERAWELASLRILGFTRAEVSRILLAELAIATGIAIPLGLAMAQGIVTVLMTLRSNESFTIPPVVSPATFATAALVVLGAGVGSALLVRRRIDRLDLVAVLKTRD
ncbi:MAG: ABC transporter permease [Pseudomonadota bacterium]